MHLENYQALLACILNPNLTTEMAISIMCLGKEKQKRNYNKKSVIKVLDTYTGDEFIDTRSNIASLLNTSEQNIYYHIKNKKVLFKRYEFNKDFMEENYGYK